MKQEAFVIWFTGISGSGKTTLSVKLKDFLEKKSLEVEILDGDVVRNFFENDLGYSRQDRIANIKRIAFAAMLMAKNGIPVIVANIAPYYEVRDFIRARTPNYTQVYLRTSVEKVMQRDIKGHYAKYKRGELKNVIGLDDTYDVPRNPHLVLDTDVQTVDESLREVISYLKEKDIIKL